MKKILALALAVLMMLSLCACGGLDAETTAQIDDILARVQAIEAQLTAEEEAPVQEAAPIMLIPPVQTGAHLAEILLSACGYDYGFEYGDTYFDTITAVNNYGYEKTWSMGEENPAAKYEVTSDAEAADGGEAEAFEWNGQMEVWSILPTTGEEGLMMINNAMGAVMEAEGFTYVPKDAAGDPSAQVNFVEDAIAAGNVGALMIAAMDVGLLESAVADAIDAGIAVAMLGADPDYPIAGNVYTAYSITGMYAVLAAEDWVQQRVAEGGNIPTDADGKYQIAIDTYYDIKDGVNRSNAIKGTVEESEIFTLVQETSAYGQDSTVTAYNNTQDVLGANPDCHVFIAYEPAMANGIANYLKDYCEDNDLDLADYCVIPCYAEDNAFKDSWAAAQEDASATGVKGYSTYGDPVIPAGDAAAEMYGPAYDALVAFAQG